MINKILMVFVIMFLLVVNVNAQLSLTDSNVKDDEVNGLVAKKITFPNIKTELNLTNTTIDKITYVGEADIYLKIKKLVPVIAQIPYDCKCKIINLTSTICDTCYNNRTLYQYEYFDIDTSKDVLNNETEIYEFKNGCSKFGDMGNGERGCSIFTDLTIAGIKIEGATWWNESYACSIEIKIEEMQGYDIINYTTFMNITSEKFNGSLITFNDIRFTLNDNTTVLKFQKDYVVNGVHAWFEVQVPSLNASSNTSIMAWFCNQTPVYNQSNPSIAFTEWDDFEGASYTGWTVTGSAYWLVSTDKPLFGSKSLRFADLIPFSYITKDSYEANNITAGIWFYDSVDAGKTEACLLRADNYTGGSAVWLGTKEDVVLTNYSFQSIIAVPVEDSNVSRNQNWHLFESSFNGTDYILSIDHNIINISASSIIPAKYEMGEYWGGSFSGLYYMDGFRYKQFYGIEPLIYFGEQFINLSIEPPTPPAIFNVTIIHDITNLYPTESTCYGNYTLFRQFREEKCQGEDDDISCINVSSSQTIFCPYGCLEDVTPFGDECSFPDWEMYLYIIIIVIVIVALMLYFNKKG